MQASYEWIVNIVISKQSMQCKLCKIYKMDLRSLIMIFLHK